MPIRRANDIANWLNNGKINVAATTRETETEEPVAGFGEQPEQGEQSAQRIQVSGDRMAPRRHPIGLQDVRPIPPSGWNLQAQPPRMVQVDSDEDDGHF